jgi:hypothetical protein
VLYTKVLLIASWCTGGEVKEAALGYGTSLSALGLLSVKQADFVYCCLTLFPWHHNPRPCSHCRPFEIGIDHNFTPLLLLHRANLIFIAIFSEIVYTWSSL